MTVPRSRTSPAVIEAEARRQRVREAQCAQREGASCKALSDHLGWRAGVGWDHCDACFAGESFIVPTVGGRIVEDVLRAPRAGWSEAVALAVADRHGSIDDAADFVIAAVPAFDRVFVQELMHTILMRSHRDGADHAWRERFVERLDQADLEAGERDAVPRTREAWRAHPACGALITNHCETCDHFAWVTTITTDVTVRCRRMGCASTCRKKFLDRSAPCPRGFARDGSGRAEPSTEAMIDA